MAFEIKKDQILRIIDIQGQQVVDLVSYLLHNPGEYLSSPRTMDYNNKIPGFYVIQSVKERHK